jgi:hypothetical protein
MRRLALLAALPNDETVDAATLYSSLAPTWSDCTDEGEIAELARVLAEHATIVDEPMVFFTFSFLSHSCAPNTALLKDAGPDVTLVALAEVGVGEDFTTDRLHMPQIYSPAYVRCEHLAEMGVVCNCPLCAGSQPEVMRAFVCPKCNAGEFVPISASLSSELGPLQCISCGHACSEEERAACAAAEQAYEDEPSLLTSPCDGISHLHWSNVQLAWSYLFELAPLEESSLFSQHREVLQVLIDAVSRLPNPSPSTLRELYQVGSALCGPDELDVQRGMLERLAQLRGAFFPRDVAVEKERDRYLVFGPQNDDPEPTRVS